MPTNEHQVWAAGSPANPSWPTLVQDSHGQTHACLAAWSHHRAFRALLPDTRFGGRPSSLRLRQDNQRQRLQSLKI